MAGDIEAEGLTSQPGAIASVVRRVFGDHNAIMVKRPGRHAGIPRALL